MPDGYRIPDIDGDGRRFVPAKLHGAHEYGISGDQGGDGGVILGHPVPVAALRHTQKNVTDRSKKI